MRRSRHRGWKSAISYQIGLVSLALFALPAAAAAETKTDVPGDLEVWHRLQQRLVAPGGTTQGTLRLALFVPPESERAAKLQHLDQAVRVIESASSGTLKIELHPPLYGYSDIRGAREACEERLLITGSTGCLWLHEPGTPGAAGRIVRSHERGGKLFWIESATAGALAHEIGHLLGLPDLYDPAGESSGIADTMMGLITEQPQPMDAFSRALLGFTILRPAGENNDRKLTLRSDEALIWRDGPYLLLLGTTVDSNGNIGGLQLIRADLMKILVPDEAPACLVCGPPSDWPLVVIRRIQLDEAPARDRWSAMGDAFGFDWQYISGEQRITGTLTVKPNPPTPLAPPQEPPHEVPWPVIIPAGAVIGLWLLLRLVRSRTPGTTA